ncbi:ABC transporter permease [Psychromicrobium sp. YIM B11713]|uniref:ABC transporter permease n=1 Tax=Psychromicrobium sp. YIM B11713 TaxID=3145233 RepID=UPI00374FA7DB
MNLVESARFALSAVAANKLRSVLTSLGILIGIAAVIILLAVGAGSSAAIRNQIAKLGTNVLTVSPISAGGRSANGAVSQTRTRSADLTLADMQALNNSALAPDIARTAPVIQASAVLASYQGSTHTIASFLGSTPDYFGTANDSLAYGSYFSDADASSGTADVVIGSTVASELFGSQLRSAIGASVSLNGQNFTVLGVLASKGASGLNDPDDVAIVPFAAAQDKFVGYSATLNSVAVQAKSAEVMNQAQNEIEMILDARHSVSAADRDYQVRNQAQVLSTATSTTQTLTLLLGTVAGISLLVGGIGVMNIMLVTVTERTREIGIRKAIGASRGSIVSQFLIESLVISLIGGILGVLIGLIGSSLPFFGTQPEVQWWTVWLAVAVSAGIGLIFGIYPANKAAKLKPIDALRYE